MGFLFLFDEDGEQHAGELSGRPAVLCEGEPGGICRGCMEVHSLQERGSFSYIRGSSVSLLLHLGDDDSVNSDRQKDSLNFFRYVFPGSFSYSIVRCCHFC